MLFLAESEVARNILTPGCKWRLTLTLKRYSVISCPSKKMVKRTRILCLNLDGKSCEVDGFEMTWCYAVMASCCDFEIHFLFERTSLWVARHAYQIVGCPKMAFTAHCRYVTVIFRDCVNTTICYRTQKI